MFKSNVFREYYAASVCYHGAILIGLDNAFTSYFVENREGLNVFEEGLLGSFSTFSRGFGSFGSACLVDRIGRKATLFVGFVIAKLAWLAIFLSSSFELLLIGRTLSGISMALLYASNVAYLSEISDQKRRGTLVALRTTTISFGMNLVTIIAYFCHWRWIAVISILLCISGSMQLINLPESKYWLLMKGRRNEALKSALWFSPHRKMEQVRLELETIEKSFAPHASGICAIFTRRASLKALLAGAALVILMTGTGRLAIITHIEHFVISFQRSFNSRKLVVVLNMFELLVCVLYALIVDKFNRKSVMHFTLYVMAFTLCGMLFYDLELRRFCVRIPILPILLLCTYLSIMVTGLMTCVTTVLSEIVTNENRGGILNIVNGINSFANAAFATVLPYFLKYVDVHYTILYFLIHVVLLMMFVHLVIPETRGKSLHECGFKASGKPSGKVIQIASKTDGEYYRLPWEITSIATMNIVRARPTLVAFYQREIAHLEV